MQTTRKTIKRRTRDAAQRAMQRHIDKMKARGWIEGDTFAGDAFLDYQMTIYFYKPAAQAAALEH